MAAIPDETKAELFRDSVKLRQAWLAAGLADNVALLAGQRRAVRNQERVANATRERQFGVQLESPDDEEMIVINVGDTTISYPTAEPPVPAEPSPVSVAGDVAAAMATKTPTSVDVLKPIGKLAKAGLLAAALASGGGLAAAGYGLWSQLRQTGPAAVDTDTDTSTQYDLQLVPPTPKGE